MEIGAKLLETAYQVLHPGTLPVADDDYIPVYDRAQLVVVDPLRIARRELVPIKCGNKGVFKAGKNTAYNDKTATGYLLSTPRGFERETLGNTCDLAATQNDSKSCLVFNGTIKLEIKDGRIVSLFDVQLKRELIPEGQTGGFIIYEDQPANWDAWDVDVYHLEKFTRLRFDEIAIVEQGLARVCVAGQTRFGSSRMTVKVGGPGCCSSNDAANLVVAS
jgi:alpha-mannosidase